MGNQQVINQVIFIVIIVVVFYFFLIRPQMKRQRERKQLIESVATGDKILTVGGIVGKVSKIKDDKMMLEVAKNVILEMSKSAVAQKIIDEPEQSTQQGS